MANERRAAHSIYSRPVGRTIELLVGRGCDLFDTAARPFAATDIGDAIVRPVDRGGRAALVVAQRRVAPVRARGVDRVALARRTLVHEERGGAGRAGQQPATDES